MSFPYMAALSYRAVGAQYSSSKTYTYGAKGMTEDGSEYRLCKTGAALTNPCAAKINYFTYLSACTGTCAEAATSGAIAIGDTSFTFLDTSTVAVDYYKDGYAVIPSSSSYDNLLPIKSSDAGAGTSVKVYLKAPFTQIYASGGTIQGYPNPWRDIRNAGAYSSGYEHFACVANINVSSGYYFWGKVAGPHWCWITGTWPGAAAYDRDVCFWIDGTIKMQDEGINTSGVSLQRAGYLMFSGNYGDALCMMQFE